jgi:hypothetical protein
MDKTAAWKMIQTAFRCGAELQGLMHGLRQELSADEYESFAVGIAAALDGINVQLIERALKAHPELKDKIEFDLAKLGRIS